MSLKLCCDIQSYLGTRPPLYSTKSVLDQKIRVENASDLEQIFGTRLAESTRTCSSALLGPSRPAGKRQFDSDRQRSKTYAVCSSISSQI